MRICGNVRHVTSMSVQKECTCKQYHIRYHGMVFGVLHVQVLYLVHIPHKKQIPCVRYTYMYYNTAHIVYTVFLLHRVQPTWVHAVCSQLLP